MGAKINNNACFFTKHSLQILHPCYINICYFCRKFFEWKLKKIYNYYSKIHTYLLI
jgi:hypothetical protein